MSFAAWARTRGARLKRAFPERQIFLRSDGQVQFLKLSPAIQVALFVAMLIGAAWIVFSTYSVMNEDEVLAAKKEELDRVTAAHQAIASRLRDMQENVLVQAEELEQRQVLIENLLNEEGLLPAAQTGDSGQDRVVPPIDPASGKESGSDKEAALSGKTMLLNDDEAMVADTRRLIRPSMAYQLDAKDRLAVLTKGQEKLAKIVVDILASRIGEIDGAVKPAGLTARELLALWGGEGIASGGPLVPDPILDRPLPRNLKQNPVFGDLVQTWQDLAAMRDSLDSFPRRIPSDNYFVSSKFGPRRDPIRKTRAIHHGLDMAGWPGEPIMAAASGVVTKAGRWGAYGNMVEIDHGNGFRTRYGHMKRIHVKRGEHVDLGQKVGEMGTSGRSTSTHLHYEIWYGGKPKDPLPFIKASDHVLKIQRRHRNGTTNPS